MYRYMMATLLAALVLLPGTAAAQVEVGLKGGVSFADVPKFEGEGATTSMRVGAAGGAHFLITIGGIVGLQTEVLYTQKGFKGEAPAGIDPSFEMQLDYVDVPVLLRLGVTGGRGLQFLVGPSFNFNTNAKRDDDDIKDEIEDFEVGLVFGLGYYGRRVLVEGRYQEGLTDIASTTDFFDNATTYKNRTFLLLFGVQVGG